MGKRVLPSIPRPRLLLDSQFAEERLEDRRFVRRPCEIARVVGAGQCRLRGGKDVWERFEENLDELDSHVAVELNRLATFRLGLAIVRPESAQVDQSSSVAIFDDVVVAVDLGRVRLDPLRACGDGADASHGGNCKRRSRSPKSDSHSVRCMRTLQIFR